MYIGAPIQNPDQQLRIDALSIDYPNDSLQLVRAFPNVDFSDDTQMPSGLVTVHPLGSKVHSGSLPYHAFTHLVVCPILGECTDSTFRGKEDKLHEAIPQFTSKPLSLLTRNLENGLDASTWSVELGEDDTAFAGVFKQNVGRKTNYFVAAQIGAPMLVRHLKNKINKTAMTFEQLLKDPDYSYGCYAAPRVASRAAYNVARAFGVPIRHTNDEGAHTETVYAAKPMRAMPSHTQVISTITTVSNNGQRMAAIFNRVTPVVANNMTKHYVYEGPFNGLAEFDVKNMGTDIGMPANSGRGGAQGAEGDAERLPAEGLIWEVGKAVSTKHPDLVKDAFRSAHSDEFLQGMQELGWKAGNSAPNLIPVCVKIYNPEIKRVSNK